MVKIYYNEINFYKLKKNVFFFFITLFFLPPSTLIYASLLLFCIKQCSVIICIRTSLDEKLDLKILTKNNY